MTVIGANFGAHAEFLDSFRQVDAFNLYRILAVLESIMHRGSWQAAGIPPFPPVARIGETTCATTVWTSDSALICSLLEIGRGAGPGVGGLLPVQVELGYQRGVFGQNFGFFAVLFC